MAQQIDLVVVGGGIAGLTAGLFAARYGLKALLLEWNIPGGQILNAERIENFPGFPDGISGADLSARIQDQAMRNGLEFKLTEATALRIEGQTRIVVTPEDELVASAVIIAGGALPRRLGIPGEEEFYGRGVSHCATCDGPFFTNETVAVIGGGDSALDEAVTLTQYASEVVLLHRRNTLRAQKVLQDRLLAHPKVKVLWDSQAREIRGNTNVQSLVIENLRTGKSEPLRVSGVFIYVGADPNTAWLKDVLSLDKAGHVQTDIWMQTPLPGIFAAGEVRANSARQLATAAGDGATAAIAAFRYVSSLGAA